VYAAEPVNVKQKSCDSVINLPNFAVPVFSSFVYDVTVRTIVYVDTVPGSGWWYRQGCMAVAGLDTTCCAVNSHLQMFMFASPIFIMLEAKHPTPVQRRFSCI